MISMESAFVRHQSLTEAIEAVGHVYCPHSVTPKGPVRRVGAGVGILPAGGQMAVHVHYSAPVIVDAGRFPDNLLIMMTASAGSATAKQNERFAWWRVGQTVALSPGQATILEFDREFAQTSLRVNVERLNAQCEQWLGHPLDGPIRFTLDPLAKPLEDAWQDCMRLYLTVGSRSAFLPHMDLEPLEDFLLSLILHGHPHNYSDELARPIPAGTPRLVMKAEQLLTERAGSRVAIADVARELGVSVRSLELGFREHRRTTPTAFLRDVRLAAVRRDLEECTYSSVTDAALNNGFTHVGRFSAAYRTAFGEPPGTTLRRHRHRLAMRRSAESRNR
ncbi:MAG: AraC family transcriptional regulator [Gammaproteobacteria bacterium]